MASRWDRFLNDVMSTSPEERKFAGQIRDVATGRWPSRPINRWLFEDTNPSRSQGDRDRVNAVRRAAPENPRQADQREGYTERNFDKLTTKFAPRGGGSGLDIPTIPHGNMPSNAYGEINDIAGFAAAEGRRIQGEYDAKAAQLKQMYRLAETPQEKAQLQFMLDNIEGQRAAGSTIIKNVYGDAIGSTMGMARGMEKRAGKAGKRQQATYDNQASKATKDITQIAGDWAARGEGLGVGGKEVSGNAQDWAGVMRGLGASEGAFEKRMGNIAANDTRQMGLSMKKEQGAQQGDLEREALRMSASATFSHQQAVAQRIHQERMALAENSSQLWGQGLQARAQFGGQAIDLQGQAAMRSGDRQWESAMDDRTFQREMFASDRQWDREQGGQGQQNAMAKFKKAAPFQQSATIGQLVDAGDFVTAEIMAQQAERGVRKQWMKKIREMRGA